MQKEVNVDIWTQIHFTALGLQISSALAGAVGGFFLWDWFRFINGNLAVAEERFKRARLFGIVLLGVLAVGFILELWYEIHMLQIG